MDNKPQDNEMDNSEVKMESGLDNRNCKPWKERTLTEKYLFIFTVVFLLIFFVLLAILLRPTGADVIYKRLKSNDTCTTVTCIRETFRLLNNVDFSSDACHDFSRMVCKTYQETIPPYKPPYISNANEDLLSIIRALLEDTDESNELESTRKARQFYHSCLREESEEHNTGNIVRELLRKAKMTDGSMSSTNIYSREKTLALLTIYGNKNPFFKFRRTPQIIYLYPGSPVLKSEVLMGETSTYIIMRMKYKKLIFNALLKMSISEESANLDAEDMVKFERRFATLAATAKCTGNSSEVALREMEDMFPELKWSVIIKYIYEYYGLENDFSQKLTILLTCEDYFRKIIHLMSNYNFRTLELFIMWSFALHYLPILDPTFRPFYREIEDVVDTHWYGNAHDADWKICAYATKHYFNSPIAHLYSKKEHSEQTEKEIESLFKDIQLAYEEVICAQEWLDEKTATQCKTTISEIGLVIGLPSNIRDFELIDAMYSLVNVTDDIMENILALDKAIFAENVIGTQLTPLYSTPMDADIYYDHDSLTIHFGATLPPVFVVGSPRYFNYGWMGFIIAREMWNPIRTLVLSDKAVSTKEARKLHMMEGCLIEQHSNCQGFNKGKSMNKNAEMESVIADQTALLAAIKAYMYYVKKNGKEYSIPGLNLSNEKLFFINFGQLMCESSSENILDKEDLDLINFNACKLNNIIGNLLQFSETFSCSENRVTNNEISCQIWE